MGTSVDEAGRLKRRALQFLVHSFLYYRLNETLIGDERFDRLTEELRTLRAKLPDTELPYAEVIDPLLGPEASGFRIRHYPPRIVSTAFKVLYAATQPDVDFWEFVERRGYRAELADEAPPPVE